MASTGTTKKIAVGNLASAQVIPPSGDTTGATDVSNINTALANGDPVQLLQAPLAAPYYIDTPILPISQSRLWGAQQWSASENDNYGNGVGESGGTVILATGGFTGQAFINMTNSTGSQYYGVDLAFFTIEGYEPSGAIYGMYVDGAWGACFMRGLCIHGAPSDNVHFTYDSTSGKVPDDWLITDCKFSCSFHGYGVYADFLDDSWIINCESSQNDKDAWYLSATTNTRLIGCKGENSGGAGFRFGGMYGGGGTTELIGCSTNLNQQDGFLFDSSVNSGAGYYTLTGCRASQDGQAGGTTYAGFRSNGGASQVTITGGTVVTGGGSGPAYGASLTGSSLGMSLTGTLLDAVTSTTYDDGSNTTPLINLLPAFTRSLGTGIGPGVVTLTDAATIAVNAALGNDFHVTLGGNRTLGAPSNPVDRQLIHVDVIQPASGGPYTLSYNSIYDFGAGSAPTLSTSANKVDTLTFRYVASLSKWTYLGVSLGF